MFNKRHIFLFILFFSLSCKSFAHDTNTATFQIRQIAPQQWIYEVMTPLYNIDSSLRAIDKQTPKADTKSVKYKEKIIAYIKQGFNVKATGYDAHNIAVKDVKLTLGQGRIKLDDHLSTLIFKIKGMPNKLSQLDFHLASMSNNVKYNNIFRLIDGDKHKRFLLNKDNDFSGKALDFFNHSQISK